MSWLPKENVVVPIDFSEESFRALDVATQFVADASHLHVIHVLPELRITEPGVVWSVDDSSRMEHAQEALRQKLSDARFHGIHMIVKVGDAGREIAQYAELVAADVIVLPSHGRTGLTRLLIGSVAERVVRLAHCPVLVIRK